MNWELPHVQDGFRKSRTTRDQIANICWITEKAREFQKNSTSVSLTMLKPLAVWITTNCGKFLERWKYQTALLVFWETCNLYAGQKAIVRSRHRTTDGFKIGKGVHQVCIFFTAYLTCMQSTSCEMPAWMKHKLESRLLGEISVTSDMQMIPP